MAKSKKTKQAPASGKPVSVDSEPKLENVSSNLEISAPLDSFASFKVLTVTFPSIPLVSSISSSQSSTAPSVSTTPFFATHPIYFKQHTSKSTDNSIPSGRSLFLVNLPVDSTKRHLLRLFRRCGEIENVVFRTVDGLPGEGFEELRLVYRTGLKAYVIFEDEECVKKALGMSKRKRVWSDALDDGVEDQPIGFALWAEEFAASRPSIDKLQKQSFEEAEERRQQEILENRNKPDADGFVTVVRHGNKNTNTDPGGATVTSISPEEAKRLMEEKKKNKKKKELTDFYRFQMRESKRNGSLLLINHKLADLRRKFEEDKKRIAQLKASRKFKPY
ncbi:Ribosomal RNA-processing protein 7 A [Nowakowskiella sp. JEL0078]|nr:Ribosomal RNA-processing protein 7 A [Nowakowskiella sp. JEL0078]